MKLTQMTRAGIVFTFDNDLPSITFRPDMASAENEEYAMLMGYQANIRDQAALSRKQKDKTIVTITEEMRHAEIQARVAYLESGAKEWSVRGPKAAPQNATILAIAAKLGITYGEAEAEVARRMLAEMVADVTI